jgi:hypothetical protein
MKEKQLKRWEKMRAKGFTLFVIGYALVLGIFLTIFNFLFEYYWDGVWKTDRIVFNLIFNLIIGAVIGWLTYRSSEKAYQKSLETKS